MEPPYSESLVALARTGDHAALAQLWRDLNPLLLRYLRGRLGDGADDVAAQTWLDASRRLDEFRGNDNEFRRWMFTIARHRSIDELRRRGRRPEDPASSLLFEPAGPDDAADQHDDLVSALALVRRLPPDQADAVLLRVVGDLDVAQVAIVMGRSQGSVRVLVHRGLRRLQVILEEERAVTDSDATTLYREQ
jgi:RNA polymerase sigma-70 factor (ECF subfamily)